jgi:hypothetical protein
MAVMSTARKAFKKYGRLARVGKWSSGYSNKLLRFEVTADDVEKGARFEGDICAGANGVLNNSELGKYADSVEIGRSRAAVINWAERIVMKFYIGPRLRDNIREFDAHGVWPEPGEFFLNPVPPSLRSGYRSPRLVTYPKGVSRPRVGKRIVIRVDSYLK